jgi:propionyl-CoA carboxylase beta chain
MAPKVTVIKREAHSGAFEVMNARHIHGDFNYAWPSVKIMVIGMKDTAKMIFRKTIEKAPDREKALSG